MAAISPVMYSSGYRYRFNEHIKQQSERDREHDRLMREVSLMVNSPVWKVRDASGRVKRRMVTETSFDDLPSPELYEPPEVYRQRLRKAIADRRARAACLDLRRRLMERGMEHIPLPRDGEMPEDYRRRIRMARKILADRRK